MRGEVHQASGMVSVRTGRGVGDALRPIRAHAFTSGVPITEVARRVVARQLVLDTDGPRPPTPGCPAPAPSWRDTDEQQP